MPARCARCGTMTSTLASDSGDDGLTHDAFLGGRVRLWQPRVGFRSGIDAVLLAAAVPARAGEAVLELGCGAGAAAACLMARVPGVTVTGVEVQEDYAALARRNGVSEVVTADLTALPADLRNRQFDHVMMNPPYFDRRTTSTAAVPGRDIARGGATALADWLRVGAQRLRPKGSLTVIQRTDRLREVFAALPDTLGSTILQPIQPRADREAALFLLQAVKTGRAAPRLRVPLVLHDGPAHLADGDDYSTAATELLRNAADLDLRR